MNAEKDFSLKRDIKLGLLVFLRSEKERHEDDVYAIIQTIERIKKDIDCTQEEWDSIKEMSERYRKF
jgi:hypothetical protein